MATEYKVRLRQTYDPAAGPQVLFHASGLRLRSPAPVIPIDDAVRVELEAMAFRDSLKSA